MNIKLLCTTPIWVTIKAIRECYDSMIKSDSYFNTNDGNIPLSEAAAPDFDFPFVIGEKDKGLVKTIIKSGHTSTIEHINFTFSIEGFSRALLQQLSRHRHASPSVQSTRYTLKKLLDCAINVEDLLYMTGNEFVDGLNINHLMSLAAYAKMNPDAPNDDLKYALPDAYKTAEILTINARSLRNMFALRMSKRALKEFQTLAWDIAETIPEEYVPMFKDIWEDHI